MMILRRKSRSYPDFILPALLAVFAVLLCGCGGEVAQQTDTTAAAAETAEPEPVFYNLEGYTVIRPEDASENVTAAATTLKKAMDSAIGATSIATDWIKRGDELPAEAREILVGKTSRPESAEVYASLRSSDVEIKAFPSGRIVIAAGSEYDLSAAVLRFINEYVKAEGHQVSAALEYKSEGKYEVDSLTLNGTEITGYSICYRKGADADGKYAADVIAGAIKDKTGYILEPVAGTSDSGKTIYITDDAADIEKYIPGGGSYSCAVVPAEDGIVLCGSGGTVISAARRLVSELFPDGCAGQQTCSLTEKISFDYKAPVYPSLEELGVLPVTVVDQKNACAAVYDIGPVLVSGLYSGTELDRMNAKNGYTGNEPVLKYTFTPTEANGFPVDNTYGNRIDECRFRYSEKLGCYVICFTSSSGFVGVAEYPSGKAVWYDKLSGRGPHSIEYLPNGNTVVALSGNGNADTCGIIIYNTSSNGSKHTEAVLEGAHAVLWDDIRGILWALGSKELRAYDVGTADRPALTQITYYGASGSFGGHDMTAVAGDTENLIISGAGAWTVNKLTGRVEPLAALATTATKCLCTTFTDLASADGSLQTVLVRTVATNVYAAHNTDRFAVFFGPSADKTDSRTFSVTFADRAFYKARIADPEYCRLG